MRHSVPLSELPAGLVFPATLADRVRFDATRGALSFDGPMFKGEFDQLNALSEDWSYRRAVSELFQLAILPAVPRQQPFPMKAVVVGVLAALGLVIGGVLYLRGMGAPQAAGAMANQAGSSGDAIAKGH